MQDIPFVSSGYRFMVTEAPTMKMREIKGSCSPRRTGTAFRRSW